MVNFGCEALGAGLEGLVEKRSIPVFNALTDIHARFIKTMPDISKKYLLVAIEKSCSAILYGAYTQKGLIMKDYVFAEPLDLNQDQYLALRQFYYDVHAASPNSVFNILEIYVEHSGNADKPELKVNLRALYNKSFDAEANSSVGVTPNGLTAVVGGADKLRTGENSGATFKVDDTKGFTTLKFK